MSEYVFRSIQGEDTIARNELIPESSCTSLYERGRILLRLLSDRKAIRIMCAPALYGKSVAAYQYTRVAFAGKNVVWVNARSPHFVVDLDTHALLSKLTGAAEPCRLVVFDAADELSSHRYQEFFLVIDALREGGSEVLITTRDRSLVGACESSRVLIDARNLLLDDAERSECDAAPCALRISSYTAYGCVPVLAYDHDRGTPRFGEALVHTNLTSPEEVLAVIAIIIQRGTLHELDPFVAGGAAYCARVVSQAFPHAGVPRRGHCFEAVHLSLDIRLTLLQAHLDELVYHSTFTNEQAHIEALVDILLAHDDCLFAYQVLTTVCTEDRAHAFCKERNVTLNTSACCIDSEDDGEGECCVHYERELPVALRAEAGLVRKTPGGLLLYTENKKPDRGETRVVYHADDRLAHNAKRRAACTNNSSCSVPVVDTSPFANQMVRNPAIIQEEQNAACSENFLRIRLFGGFELHHAHKRLPSVGEVRQKAKLLIALLVINRNKELPRFWIERIIWPDVDDKRARSSFYNLWSYVRHLLIDSEGACDCLSRSRDTVLLRDIHVKSDVIEIERLCAHLAHHDNADQCHMALRSIEDLYRGSLLPGIENAQLEAYRSTYQTKVLDAVVQGIDLLIKQGDLRSALHYSSYAFALDPTREDVCYLFMTIQKRLGQFTGAMSTFMGCRKALIDRFGVDGSRRLDALYEEILHEVS